MNSGPPRTPYCKSRAAADRCHRPERSRRCRRRDQQHRRHCPWRVPDPRHQDAATGRAAEVSGNGRQTIEKDSPFLAQAEPGFLIRLETAAIDRYRRGQVHCGRGGVVIAGGDDFGMLAGDERSPSRAAERVRGRSGRRRVLHHSRDLGPGEHVQFHVARLADLVPGGKA